MDNTIKASFLDKWEKYFPGSELPIACYYSDELNGAEFPERPKPNQHGLTCIFSQLAPVRRGKARAFNQDNLGCWGSKGVLGHRTVRSQRPDLHKARPAELFDSLAEVYAHA